MSCSNTATYEVMIPNSYACDEHLNEVAKDAIGVYPYHGSEPCRFQSKKIKEY